MKCPLCHYSRRKTKNCAPQTKVAQLAKDGKVNIPGLFSERDSSSGRSSFGGDDDEEIQEKFNYRLRQLGVSDTNRAEWQRMVARSGSASLAGDDDEDPDNGLKISLDYGYVPKVQYAAGDPRYYRDFGPEGRRQNFQNILDRFPKPAGSIAWARKGLRGKELEPGNEASVVGTPPFVEDEVLLSEDAKSYTYRILYKGRWPVFWEERMRRFLGGSFRGWRKWTNSPPRYSLCGSWFTM